MTDDLISRKAALAILGEYLAAWDDKSINGSSLAIVIDAIAALPSVGVTVKPLEWDQLEVGPSYDVWEAMTIFGRYKVQQASGKDYALLVYPNGTISRQPTIEAAKAAAQSDYEARTLSALDVQPAPAPSLDGIKIEIRSAHDFPGFGAYMAPIGDYENPALIYLNIPATILAAKSGDIPASDVPQVIVETIVHEVGHVIEKWAGVEFDEERVEALAMQVFATAEDGTPAPLPDVAALVGQARLLIDTGWSEMSETVDYAPSVISKVIALLDAALARKWGV